MFKKKHLEKLVEKGLKDTFKEIDKFESEHQEITKEINDFDKQMKEWSLNRRFTRNK
jgi:hypothetical protein